MRDILYVLKLFGITAVLVLALQVHIGEKTAETHFHNFLRTSAAVDWLQSAVDGGLIAMKTGYIKVRSSLDPIFHKFSKKKQEAQEKGREKVFKIKRHVEEKAEDLY